MQQTAKIFRTYRIKVEKKFRLLAFAPGCPGRFPKQISEKQRALRFGRKIA
jgi:hypothetical protein